MITVLVGRVFRVVVVVDAVIVVTQSRPAILDQVLAVRFRLEPEHFHLVGVHGAVTHVLLAQVRCRLGTTSSPAAPKNRYGRETERGKLRISCAQNDEQKRTTAAHDRTNGVAMILVAANGDGRDRRRGRSTRYWFSSTLLRFTVRRSSGRRRRCWPAARCARVGRGKRSRAPRVRTGVPRTCRARYDGRAPTHDVWVGFIVVIAMGNVVRNVSYKSAVNEYVFFSMSIRSLGTSSKILSRFLGI